MDSTRKKIAVFLLVSFISFSLQGCMNAAITSGQAVYNRQSIQTTLNDHYVTMKAEREIYLDNTRFANTRVSVSSFNGVVLLTGQVPEASQKEDIEKIVRKISEADEVHNLITVSAPASALVQVSDSWITTKIKSKLLATNGVDPAQIKVITENGVVYLMGLLPKEEAEIATDLARTTDGVQSVVTIFGYITISKT